eukprot:2622589-Amphidinium_carterae.2
MAHFLCPLPYFHCRNSRNQGREGVKVLKSVKQRDRQDGLEKRASRTLTVARCLKRLEVHDFQKLKNKKTLHPNQQLVSFKFAKACVPFSFLPKDLFPEEGSRTSVPAMHTDPMPISSVRSTSFHTPSCKW